MDISKLNLTDADGFYAELLACHEGLGDAQSALLNAKLVFLLANLVGDPATLRAALAAAREDITP